MKLKPEYLYQLGDKQPINSESAYASNKTLCYEVFPQKNVETPDTAGRRTNQRFRPVATYAGSVDQDNRLESQTPIAFHVTNPTSGKPKNVVRDAMMSFAFRAGSSIAKSADISRCGCRRRWRSLLPVLFLDFFFKEACSVVSSLGIS